MTTIDRNLLRTGFDVEAVISGRYIQGLLTAAYDGGLIPSSTYLSKDEVAVSDTFPSDSPDRTVVICAPRTFDMARLYQFTDVALPNGDPLIDAAKQFATTILIDDPRGADLKLNAAVGTLAPGHEIGLPNQIYVGVDLVTTSENGVLSSLGLAVSTIDIDIDQTVWKILVAKNPDVTKEQILAGVKKAVDTVLPLHAIARGRRVEDVQIAWLPAGDADEPVLGVYLNLHLRTADEPGTYLAARGDVSQAVNFLPPGQDVAMATRAGLYDDARLDTWSRLAAPDGSSFDHPLRKSLLNPDSERVGDVNALRILRIPPVSEPGGTTPTPQNGLRLQLDAHYEGAAPVTADVTMTVDLRPEIDGDGLLQWHTDLDVDVDAVSEWFTGWLISLAAITFGPIGAGIALGAVVATEIGAGVYLGEAFDTKVHDRADATLTDVIPDRLTVGTVRWDPFYATKHQAVVKPAQAEFGDDGFSLCGTVFVGRELVPPVDTVLVHPVRDGHDVLTGLVYRVPGPPVVAQDKLAIGTHRRDFTPADPDAPDVFALTLDQLRERRDDPDGPLVLTHLPYFPAAVHVVGHQIAHLMGIAASQLETVRGELRAAWKARVFGQVQADQGVAIHMAVVADLSAGGATPTDDEINVEVKRRIDAIVDASADDEFRAPEPLEMVLDGSVRDQLTFDLRPREWLAVRTDRFVDLDPTVQAVNGQRVSDYLRDAPDPGPDGFTLDNLLNRPRYTPGPDGPVFRE